MDRKANESYLDYVRRCTQAVEDKTIDYMEWGDSLLGSENVYSSENLRKAFYVVAKILPKLDISQLSLSTEEEKVRLEELQEEIIKERIKCRDQRRELQKYITSEARFENLVEVLRDEVRKIEAEPYQITIDDLAEKDTNRKSAILCLSDWHTGAVVNNSLWNEFNIDILRRRVSELVNKTLYHLREAKVNHLVIEIFGDMVEGCINIANRVQAEEDVITQIMIAADLLSGVISTFASEIPEVEVIVTTGNHGRLVPDKNASIARDNVERLLHKFLPLKLANFHNISYLFSDYDCVKYELDDKVICVAHGQYDKISTAIENFVKLFGVVPDEIHLGHTHGFKEVNDSNIRIVVNGSLKGADEYSVNICRGTNKPSQNLIIFGLDRAMYEIVVK